ncbi:extracellular solute-binding protein [Calothrix rhizosoleniae]|uniref:extracellular solute-binding protein n=1 Tax=Calothrix rhizosoleniae TaxID=888997 RepID=UPI000B4A20EE|nr:extracellular solute-binding protein [Calothrix rhizosoleniae]
MHRRYFLQGISSIAISQLLVGCGNTQQVKFKVILLKNSIPDRLVKRFGQSIKQKTQLKFSPVEQLQPLFKQLQTWRQPKKSAEKKQWNVSLRFWRSQTDRVADLVTMGNYWLDVAIQEELIQPLEQEKLEKLANWSSLPPQWQKLVRRNQEGKLDAQGKIWAAPYRWGSTMIVYRRDKFKELGWQPQDWQDLWHPDLRDRISVLEQPREVIGLVLKKLGKSYNTENLDSVPELEKELRSLNKQVKFYSSDRYLEPLMIGDTWLAVGWSSDILPVIVRNPKLSAVISQSGTALWADMWVRPYKAELTNQERLDLSYKWIDFCWQKETAKQITLLTKSNSPIATKIKDSEVQKPLRNFLLNNAEVLNKSELINFLAPDIAAKYESLFAKIRNG